MKIFEIWIGYYSIDGHQTTSPELVGIEEAIDFRTACFKHELKSTLLRISNGELQGNLNEQDYKWWYDVDNIYNSWLGKYYSSKKEAEISFL